MFNLTEHIAYTCNTTTTVSLRRVSIRAYAYAWAIKKSTTSTSGKLVKNTMLIRAIACDGAHTKQIHTYRLVQNLEMKQCAQASDLNDDFYYMNENDRATNVIYLKCFNLSSNKLSEVTDGTSQRACVVAKTSVVSTTSSGVYMQEMRVQ